MRDGVLIAAAEEERFSRIKHDHGLPQRAFRYCLSEGGISIEDIDCIAYYEDPVKKLGRQLWARHHGKTVGELWHAAMRPDCGLRERLGFQGEILYFDHHASHAAASYLFSEFEDAAVLTLDGVGEWTTTAYGRASANAIELFEQVRFPHSLGLLYSALTSFLGFEVLSGEYKVMGLAPYGKPRFAGEIRRLIRMLPEGQFELDLAYFDFSATGTMYTPALAELLGGAPRVPESELTEFHQDVARSLQLVLEEVMLEKASYLYRRVGSANLCMGGGVALNVVANGRVLRDGPFRRLFVQPAAGDAGSALGAAALAYVKKTGRRPDPLQHVYLGPAYTSDRIAEQLEAAGLPALDFRTREPELLEAVVDRLTDHKVVAWFHGRMEMGPRALGGRSILADPRDPDVRERLNRLVKMREAFRPFAPSVLDEHAASYFALDHASPYMLEVCAVRVEGLPAITHVDGSARPQTVSAQTSPRYARLLEAFRRRTGCALIVNTSFNVRGEPIVCTPIDAMLCMINSGIDALVLEDFIIDRSIIPPAWRERVTALHELAKPAEFVPLIYTFL
jgi:carbamoyltransferase